MMTKKPKGVGMSEEQQLRQAAYLGALDGAREAIKELGVAVALVDEIENSINWIIDNRYCGPGRIKDRFIPLAKKIAQFKGKEIK
jgi:hypothetical protein